MSQILISLKFAADAIAATNAANTTLEQESVPPSFDVAEAEGDLAALDKLRPVFARIRSLPRRPTTPRCCSVAAFSRYRA